MWLEKTGKFPCHLGSQQPGENDIQWIKFFIKSWFVSCTLEHIPCGEVGCWHPLSNEVCSGWSRCSGGKAGHVWPEERQQLLRWDPPCFHVKLLWLGICGFIQRVPQSAMWNPDSQLTIPCVWQSASVPGLIFIHNSECWCVSEPVWANQPLLFKDPASSLAVSANVYTQPAGIWVLTTCASWQIWEQCKVFTLKTDVCFYSHIS